MRSAILIIIAICIVAAAAIARDDRLDQVLAKMQESAKTLRTIKASIQQEKFHSQIGAKESYRGKLIFKHLGNRRDKVRIDYERTNQVVAVDGDKIYLYQPKINQAFITCRSALVKDHPDLSFITALYAPVAELKASYSISYLRDENFEQANTAVLQLIPKVASAEKQTLMWVNRQGSMPIRFEVTERNGDITTLTLRNITRNEIINDEEFHVKWPKSTNEHKECK